MASLPPPARAHLEKQLDWDNDVDEDLNEIAYYMEDWDLAKLRSQLKLTETDAEDIRPKYKNVDAVTQR